MNNTLNQLLSELADEIDITDSQEGAIRVNKSYFKSYFY